MRVKIDYRDKNLEVVNSETYHLEDYCHLLSQRTLSTLYQVEEVLEGKLEFRKLRHFLFDLAGDISRLPDNIIDQDQCKKIEMKQPDKGFFSFLKKGD